MAQKAIITFTDLDNGEVGVKLEFDPPAKGVERATNAMALAIRALQAAQEAGEEVE